MRKGGILMFCFSFPPQRPSSLHVLFGRALQVFISFLEGIESIQQRLPELLEGLSGGSKLSRIQGASLEGRPDSNVDSIPLLFVLSAPLSGPRSAGSKAWLTHTAAQAIP